MYSPSTSIARAPVPCAAGSCKAHLLESQLLRAYGRILHHATQEEVDSLVARALGPARAVKASNQRNQADEREEYLDEKVPELVRLLKPDEQRALAPLLLEQGDLAAFAAAVVKLNAGNSLRKREVEPALDDPLVRAVVKPVRSSTAHLQSPEMKAKARASWQRDEHGHFIKKSTTQPTGGPPLELTPAPAKAPVLRTKKKPRRRVPLVLRGQYSIWPPVSVGAAFGGGL
ncbi:MAG: hypothetical protein ACRYFZ_09610 [Janthinobacterium lividum]